MLTNNEQLILKNLRVNSRQSFARLARELNIPIASVFDIHEKLQNKIIKHTSLINFEKIGYPVRIMLAIETDEKKKIQVLLDNPNMNNLYFREKGLMADMVFKSLKEKHEFLEYLSAMTSFKFYDVVEELKRETFTP
ncbi:MAG: Lrp/AsnC family transcriptional regulator [archaeon]